MTAEMSSPPAIYRDLADLKPFMNGSEVIIDDVIKGKKPTPTPQPVETPINPNSTNAAIGVGLCTLALIICVPVACGVYVIVRQIKDVNSRDNL
jgi:hypothetical protein